MAEFIMKQLIDEAGLNDMSYVNSKATSTEEIGNSIYPHARAKLQQMGISIGPHQASQITRDDYAEYDYIIGMDSANMRNMQRIFGGDSEGKLYKLRSFSGSSLDIDDPWYSDDFDTAYDQIFDGCKCLLKHLTA